MSQSFSCPNCSAPLDLPGDGSATLRCPYCHTSVIIPSELRVKDQAGDSFSLGYHALNREPYPEFDHLLGVIRQKAMEGDHIEAIRLLRGTFELSLKKAKDLVEAMQNGQDVDFSQLAPLVTSHKTSLNLSPSTIQELTDLLRRGEKISAIILFRQATGLGLKDAKEAVEGMEAAISAEATPDWVDQQSISPASQSTQQTRVFNKGKSRSRGFLTVGIALFILLTGFIPILAGMASKGGPLAQTWARVNPFGAGNLTLQFGNEGTGAGYFTDPRYVAVDNNGHIFVAEFDGGRIQVFDEGGNYLSQWYATGEDTGDIYISGMAADRSGKVYAVAGSELYIYDGMSGDLLGKLEHPEGWGFDDVTVAPDGRVVAAWYKNRDDIIRFNSKGQVDLLVENAISNVTHDSELDMRVTVDGTGNIYVLAYFNEAVFFFSPDGRYISRFGSMGDGEGQFTSPRAIAVDNLGKIYIADFPGVMIYASDGRYLDTLSVNGAVMGMAFDDENNLYAVVDNSVMRFHLK